MIFADARQLNNMSSQRATKQNAQRLRYIYVLLFNTADCAKAYKCDGRTRENDLGGIYIHTYLYYKFFILCLILSQ